MLSFADEYYYYYYYYFHIVRALFVKRPRSESLFRSTVCTLPGWEWFLPTTRPVQGLSIAREQLQWLNVSSRSHLSQLRRTRAPLVLCDFTGFRSGSLRLHSYGTRRGVTFHKNGDPNYGPPFCHLNSIHTNVLSLKTTSETQSLYAREPYGLDRPGSESREV